MYPYTEEKKEVDRKEAEEEGVHYLEGNITPVNVFLSLEEKALIVPLLEKIGWGKKLVFNNHTGPLAGKLHLR